MKTVEDIMTENPLTIDEETTVSLALNRMRDNKIAQLPVVSGRKYIGMISYRDILRRRSIHLNSKIKNFVTKSPELKRRDTLERAVNLLRDSAMGALPVVENGKIAGVVSRTDIIKNIEEFNELKGVQTFDLMQDAYFAKPDEDLESILEKVRAHDVDTINVADEKTNLLGLIRIENILDYEMKTKERVRKGDFTGERNHPDIDINSLMEQPVFCYEDEDLFTASEELVKNHLHNIAICDKGKKIVGVLSVDDIISSLWSKESTEGILVNISGLGAGDTDLYSTIYSMVEKFTERYSKLENLKNGTMNIHVVKHHSEEGRIKYSIRTRLIGRKINMTESSSGWNFGKVLSDIFDDYESRTKREKEKN